MAIVQYVVFLSSPALTSNPTGIFAVKEAAPAAITNYSTNTTLYRYNAEGIDDFGWGCAWRSILTCLSHYGITISIADLYHQFGREESMVLLHRQLYPNQPWTMSSPYADPRGWANPIIGQLILHALGIHCKALFLSHPQFSSFTTTPGTAFSDASQSRHDR